MKVKIKIEIKEIHKNFEKREEEKIWFYLSIFVY